MFTVCVIGWAGSLALAAYAIERDVDLAAKMHLASALAFIGLMYFV